MKSKITVIFVLQILLMMFSVGNICSKKAASYEFLSMEFLAFYACLILILGLYAIGWQQILRRLPLTVAFANKAVTVVWGLIWGIVIFKEKISLLQIIGSILVILGIILYSLADQPEKEGN